jgi:hypothetical protein
VETASLVAVVVPEDDLAVVVPEDDVAGVAVAAAVAEAVGEDVVVAVASGA